MGDRKLRRFGAAALAVATFTTFSQPALADWDDDERRFSSRFGRAKNVIFFVGDGMGVSTVSAARVFSVGVNGELVVAFDLDSPEFAERFATSKYDPIPGFADRRAGHIVLQDHGNDVWFRSIKIRRLP